MKTRFIAKAIIAFLILGVIVSGIAYTSAANSKISQSYSLIGLLPASDGVVGIDSKRLITETMPKLLVSNQQMLGSINAKLEEVQTKTGIDIRKFDSVAIGVTTTKINEKEYDFDPVVLARGSARSDTIIETAKTFAKGEFREEKLGGHTIYVFSPGKLIDQPKAIPDDSKLGQMIGKSLSGLSKEVAITALSDDTVAFGSLARVRASIEAGSQVSPELTTLLAGKEAAVISFAMRTPTGMSNLLPLDNDDLGSNIDSIRFVSGSLDMIATGMSLKIAAKTTGAEQAQGLTDTLVGLKSLGKMFLGNSKRPDQKVYARMIDNVKISRNGTDVNFDLLVPQTDIDVLVGAK